MPEAALRAKVALARALLTSPVVLLLDEPTTGLDPRSKLEVQDFIRDVRTSHDSTILLCTHDLAEAHYLRYLELSPDAPDRAAVEAYLKTIPPGR